MDPIFTPEEVDRLERAHPDGLSVAAVMELMRGRGVALAEATFRKYVQLGLLPRSRRVGRKGKHRGSHGLYPVAAVSRLAELRHLMDAGLTLEDLRRSALAYANDVEGVRRAAEAVVTRLELEVNGREIVSTTALRKLQTLRTQASALALALEEAAREVCPPVASRRVVDEQPAVEGDAGRDARGRRPATQAAAGRVGRKGPGARSGQSR